jgi:hypothetical protein
MIELEGLYSIAIKRTFWINDPRSFHLANLRNYFFLSVQPLEVHPASVFNILT